MSCSESECLQWFAEVSFSATNYNLCEICDFNAEEKLVDIDSPIIPKKAAIANAPPNRGSDARMRRTISETGQLMWDTLKKNKGSVTITDILRICEKPTSKVIRVPGVTEGFSDVNFKGFPSANEMLENSGVDVKKVTIKKKLKPKVLFNTYLVAACKCLCIPSPTVYISR